MRVALLLLLAVVAAGCAAPGEPGEPPRAEAAADPATEALEERAAIVDAGFGVGAFAFDVLCAMGGSVEIARTDARILAGTAALEVRITHGLSTGMQLGYAIDGSDVTWLPVTEDVQTIAVAAEQWETAEGPLRWTFHFQNNTPLTRDQCYTGAAFGGGRMLVEAVPA